MMKFLNGAVKWWVAVFLIKKENRELFPVLAGSPKFRNMKLLTFSFFFFSCGCMCCVLVCECVDVCICVDFSMCLNLYMQKLRLM